MINVYRVKYKPATNTKGAYLVVTRIDDHKSHHMSYDYGSSQPMKQAISLAFSEPLHCLEFVGSSDTNKNESFYAIQHKHN